MHSVLRPELRGAHRILRATRSSRFASSHQTIRSYSAFQRLQAQSSSSSTPKPPSRDPHTDNGHAPNSNPQPSVDHFSGPSVDDFLDALKKYPAIASWIGPDSTKTPTDEPDITTFTQNASEEEEKRVETHLGKGEIPSGYRIVDDVKDIPQWARKFGKVPDLPFLLPEVPAPFLRMTPLPKDFKLRSQTAGSDEKTPANLDSAPSHETNGQPNTIYYGSVSARRKRARDNKLASQPSEQLPSWFHHNNVSLLRSDDKRSPGVLPVEQSRSGVYVPVPATAALAHAEAVQPNIDQAPAADAGPLEHAYGAGGEQPKPGDESSSPRISVPTHDVQNHITLSNQRYYIQQHQYQELLDTFRGRLQTPAVESKLSESPLALNHLTINHCAKDADTLLDTLVSDLCHTTGADKVRLDVQDISDLIAQADIDSSTAQDGSKLSFRIYKEMYAPTNPYEEDVFPVEEDEDDMNDEDDSTPSSSPFGIGISGVGLPKDMFSRLTKSLNNSGGQMIELVGPGRASIRSSPSSSGRFGSLIESIISSRGQARSQGDVQIEETAEKPQPADARPLVIHLANYRALQDHALSQAFMSDILYHAGRSTAKIMIVGTDSAREDVNQKSALRDPRSILEEQNRKSYGLSSNILLTPVFPSVDAELALIRDRENRIRNINARHLWRVLKAKGVSLHNLEAGFWSRDYSENVGKADWDELSDGFWPFLQVQRVAALIAGESSSASPSSSPISNALMTIKLSDQSKQEWASRNQPLSQVAAEKETEQPANKTLGKIRAKASRHEKKLLSGVIEPKKIATTFKDIHIPAETIEALQNLTTLSLVRPEAFRYGVLKSDRIPGLLLYGPPGTGKTLAAKAVAKESGATMLEVSAADLNDMYVGEGEKNVQALFSLAKKLSPCVVFLDEADAMFSARATAGRRVSHRELLNQFLKEWDGMSNDSGSAFIMVATNRPMDLDDAVLRRLPRRILVDLPTENDRLEILKIHLRHESLSEEVDLPDLAKKTPFYSGSDLKNVAVAAALNAVREENEAAKQYRLNNPDSDKAYQYPEKRILTKKHFEKALEEISASISEDMSSLKEIKKFDEQYGDRRGRKRKSPRWGFKSAKEADQVLETVKVRS